MPSSPDPPYPEIDRPYGRMTEAAWTDMMHAVVRECRRILKPTGSAVFILQPNSRKVGSMRAWLWEFMAWCCREWNMVQDAWWWNHAALPEAHSIQGKLLRCSLKACIWLGAPNCWRHQESVLWSESQANIARRAEARLGRRAYPGGQGVTEATISGAAVRRGGVTPFNVLPFANTNSQNSAGAHGHGAGTPLALCSWWTRYLCPPGGVILDPFFGSGTVGLAAFQHGCDCIGIEKVPEYFAIAQQRIKEAQGSDLFSQGGVG